MPRHASRDVRASAAPTPGPPALRVMDVFVDLPNFECALRSAFLDSKVSYAKLGAHLAAHAPDGPYRLGKVYCFAAPRIDAQTGNTLPDATLDRIGGTAGVSLILGHRTRYAKKEKGVDINLAIRAIDRAGLHRYDVAALVSADTDFLYLVRYLQQRRKKPVYWVHLPNQASNGQLRGECQGTVMITHRNARSLV